MLFKSGLSFYILDEYNLTTTQAYRRLPYPVVSVDCCFSLEASGLFNTLRGVVELGHGMLWGVLLDSPGGAGRTA